MKLPTLNKISKRFIDSTAVTFRAFTDVFKADDNTFTQDNGESRNAKYENKNIANSRETSNEKTVLIKIMKESEPYWL